MGKNIKMKGNYNGFWFALRKFLQTSEKSEKKVGLIKVSQLVGEGIKLVNSVCWTERLLHVLAKYC